MSGEWECPGCDYMTEALTDGQHVYDCLVVNNIALRRACQFIANQLEMECVKEDTGELTPAHWMFWVRAAQKEEQNNTY